MFFESFWRSKNLFSKRFLAAGGRSPRSPTNRNLEYWLNRCILLYDTRIQRNLLIFAQYCAKKYQTTAEHTLGGCFYQVTIGV